MIRFFHPLWEETKNYANNCSWRAGKNLACMMDQNQFVDWERIIVVTDNNSICGYCTVQKEDCIADLPYTPYISYIFVDEDHRGQRLSEKMIDFAADYLKELGYGEVYLISDHEDLYEKYGFVVIDKKMAPWGSVEKIYRKDINSISFTE